METVKSFQKKIKVEPTGVVTDRTAYVLMDQLRDKLQQEDTQMHAALKALGEK